MAAWRQRDRQTEREEGGEPVGRPQGQVMREGMCGHGEDWLHSEIQGVMTRGLDPPSAEASAVTSVGGHCVNALAPHSNNVENLDKSLLPLLGFLLSEIHDLGSAAASGLARPLGSPLSEPGEGPWALKPPRATLHPAPIPPRAARAAKGTLGPACST